MIKNFLVTGDTHGRVLERLNQIPSIYEPSETALIILGDAGINFWFDIKEQKQKSIINKRGFTIYCVRGNHEERPENLPRIMYVYDENVKNGVILEQEFPNIRYLMDGEKYEIMGKSVLVIGGAYSVDKWVRLHDAGVYDKLHPDYTNSKKTGWFPDEQLYDWERKMIEEEHFGKHYDVILTHTCPIIWEPRDLFLPDLDQSEVDKSMELWLDDVRINIDWNIWLFGHYHADRSERRNVEIYYKEIENWNDIMERWENPNSLNKRLKVSPYYYIFSPKV